MKFKTLTRHFREGMKNIVRNGWMSVASIGAVTVSLVLVGTFITLILNINQMAKKVEEDVEIKTLIELTADEQDIVDLASEIESIPEVENVVFSSKDDELLELIQGMGEDGQVWSMIEEDNPLNHAYIVKTTLPQDTEMVATKIEKMDNVYRVNYGQEVIPKLFKFNQYARTIGIVLIVGLVLTAMFLISNTIKLTIMARSREIGIMKLVGATNSFIRGPFFVEGLLLGIFGSIVPIALISIGYKFLFDSLSEQKTFHFVNFLPYNPFIWQLSGIILLIGAFIGVWGCLMSVRKFLRV